MIKPPSLRFPPRREFLRESPRAIVEDSARQADLETLGGSRDKRDMEHWFSRGVPVARCGTLSNRNERDKSDNIFGTLAKSTAHPRYPPRFCAF